jgi:type I restriction enzyme R subunit
MSTIGQSERNTQNLVIALFRDELDYDYLGDWTDRVGFDGKGNSNIEEGLLTSYLNRFGYSPPPTNQPGA